mmetsp:Transcript_35615/g.72590  ORF Transcript_35615/g.72590 Transcript_35615/m.72590 type:complete len:238 (-) Transcript_35615:103-816(-)
MNANACFNILSERPPQSIEQLALEKPHNLMPPQTIDLPSGTVKRNDVETEDRSKTSAPAKVHFAAVAVAASTIKDFDEVEIIKVFERAQERRVFAYTDFEGKFQTMINQGSFSEYPAACEIATGRFSAVSIDACAAIEALTGKGDNCAAGIIKRVQSLEAEKLTLTAALHLEQIRRKQLGVSDTPPYTQGEVEELSPEASSKLHIFDQNIADISTQLLRAVVGICEALEELMIERRG